jgi:hypothetical protein
LNELSGTGYHSLFEEREYGEGLHGIVVGFICRDPKLNFKRRVRFAKKEKMLYMDIMLDLDQMRKINHDARKRIVVERLADEVPSTLRKYSFPDFDEARFVADLKWCLNDIGGRTDGSASHSGSVLEK